MDNIFYYNTDNVDAICDTGNGTHHRGFLIRILIPPLSCLHSVAFSGVRLALTVHLRKKWKCSFVLQGCQFDSANVIYYNIGDSAKVTFSYDGLNVIGTYVSDDDARSDMFYSSFS